MSMEPGVFSQKHLPSFRLHPQMQLNFSAWIFAAGESSTSEKTADFLAPDPAAGASFRAAAGCDASCRFASSDATAGTGAAGCVSAEPPPPPEQEMDNSATPANIAHGARAIHVVRGVRGAGDIKMPIPFRSRWIQILIAGGRLLD